MGDVPRRSTGSVGSRATSRNATAVFPEGNTAVRHERSGPSCDGPLARERVIRTAGRTWSATGARSGSRAHLLGAWAAGKHLLGPWGHAWGHAFEGTGGHFVGAWAQGRPLVGHWADGMHEEPWPRPAAVRAKAVIRLVIAMSSIVDEVVSRRLDRVDAQTIP